MIDTDGHIINFIPDTIIGRIELLSTLVFSLGDKDSTEEQKNMIRKAINLLFDSCYMDLTRYQPDKLN
jgi:hypothetical protein|tara:strand:+ start:367 stop:570 length:204 start_codon:yes stop_codon:yes gene_type:complete